MIVRVESPALVSTCSTTTAGGTSTGGCGRGRAEVREGFCCACSAGASVPSRRAPARRIRVMRGSIYLVRQFYTSPGLSLRGQRKTTRSATVVFSLLLALHSKTAEGSLLRGFARSG